MFGSFGTAAYTQVNVETGVAAADPHKLIGMLYEGLLQSLARAREAMRAGEIARKGESISRAIRILEEGLRGSLDIARGGSIAQQLDALYEYMINRLLFANLKNDPATVEEVVRLATELRDAWQAMPEEARTSMAAA
ncbi:MAG: flagellar export chaperone FliS [Pseudomonadota bacterium]|nr:MAG: flagellar export chaperone FliS [Pseudomonadota bacterium]